MTNLTDREIGLLDSGVGGLTVAREITRFLPRQRLIYYGDTLHLPYGPRDVEEVREFVFRIIDFLIEEKEAGIIVLACNTATAFTLAEAKERYPVPIFGTVAGATRKAVELTRNRKIGVIGTEGTISSRAYQKALLDRDRSLEVSAAACPDFVELVEEGKFDGPEVSRVAHHYLDGLKEEGVDTLILGCTHYPYLMPVIQGIMGDRVRLINPAVEMAREVKKVLTEMGLLNKEEDKGRDIKQQEFLVSDMERVSKNFLRKGNRFLKLPSLEFREINIFG